MKWSDVRRWVSSHRRLTFWLVLGLLVVGTVLDAFFIEPRRVQLVTYDVTVPGLSPQLDGFRVVQLSDLHRRWIVPDGNIRRAVDLANTAQADVALLTGDFVSNNASNAEPSCEMLSRLTTRLGSFAVLGNHDHKHAEFAIPNSLARNGIRLLNNESLEVAPGLFIVGIDDLGEKQYDVAKSFANVPNGAARVVMTHNPQLASQMQDYQGLMVSGHTHGGQICLPFSRTANLAGLLGWPYIKGWYSVGGMLVYVNRGIGMTGIPARFFCRPEVTLYILHPGNSLSQSGV